MFGLAVRKGQLDIIKFLVTEYSVSVDGEQSVYVSPAICGVCEHRTLGTIPFSWIDIFICVHKLIAILLMSLLIFITCMLALLIT